MVGDIRSLSSRNRESTAYRSRKELDIFFASFRKRRYRNAGSYHTEEEALESAERLNDTMPL